MWMSVLIVVVVVVMFTAEAIPLLKKGNIKEFRVFSVLLLFGTSLSIALSLKVAIPSPIDWIEFIYKPLTDWLQTTLK
ncbi:hypothetical protein [Sporosarcina limicola]|uniref:Mannose/fructose/N-acetylgalactosamine-specific phosphotransferase system component IIC n=1 Tax=Sporosarcina limicola TaxID=34101 RepID=A0A927MMS1_9BACL|nr:hypothetical protein [Sporosarcina limicola]MBE1555982.1 mannose/fructose/N-acetylgalactosamine-specific phosphotransferase system component IIC [Sporosarcina limicola]